MAAATRPPVEPARPLPRFSRAQRWVHWVSAALMGLCLLTAAILYIGPLSVLIGRRALVANVHIAAGIALPVPILLGLLSRAFRSDVDRLNRFGRVDWEWLRRRDRRSADLPVGKFNAGQKLNAAFVTGAIVVQLGTGLLMRFANHWPISLRIGATFVHDWLAYAVVAVVAGHLWFAMRDPEARAGMRHGFVAVDWARMEHRGWAESLVGAPHGTPGELGGSPVPPAGSVDRLTHR